MPDCLLLDSMKRYARQARHPCGPAGREPGPRRGTRWRRGFAALAGLLALAAAGCSGSSPAPPAGGARPPAGEPAGATQRSGVTSGALFGGDAPLAPQAARLGRKLAIVRVYYRFGEQFPLPRDRRLMAGGSTLLVSLDSVPGRGGPSYASIAAGRYDTLIRSFLDRVEQSAVRYHLGAIYVCFEHEANAPRHLALGTPAEFIKAWDHIHQLAESAHLNWNQGGRLHWVLILTHVAFTPESGRPAWAARAGQARSFWPGANEVDIVAADGYNSGACRPGQAAGGSFVDNGTKMASPASLFGPVLSFARAHGGLPVFIAEWGSVPYSSPSEQPSFINQMRAFVTANREIAAVLYWNSYGQHNGCDYSINGHPAALGALASMGRSPALQGRLVPGARAAG